jgi:hypothetical protein
MNNLSWFLYLADAVNGVGLLLGTFGAIITAAGALWLTASLFSYETVKQYPENPKGPYDYKEVPLFVYDKYKPWAIFVIIVGIFMLITSVLVPSRNALYMIAASQMGEQVLQLEQVQSLGGEAGALASDTIELLRQKIGEQLNPVKEE